MKTFFQKILGKGNEHIVKTKVQSLPVKLKLEVLTDKEIEYVQSNIGLAGELLKDIGLVDGNHIFYPEKFPRAIKMWFETDLQSRFGIDVNMYSNAIACGWGNYLEERLGFMWHVITDEYGTEIGLYHEKNDTTVFPFKSTAKSFNNKDFELLPILTEKLKVVIAK